MEASREFSRTPRRLPPCSDVSVFQKTRMSHFWDTHHSWAFLGVVGRSLGPFPSLGSVGEQLGNAPLSPNGVQRFDVLLEVGPNGPSVGELLGSGGKLIRLAGNFDHLRVISAIRKSTILTVFT